jgi:hypothetical protein
MVDSEERRGAVGLKKVVNHLDAEVSTVERLGRPEYSSKRDGNRSNCKLCEAVYLEQHPSQFAVRRSIVVPLGRMSIGKLG